MAHKYGYRFTHTVENECQRCAGDGVMNWSPSVSGTGRLFQFVSNVVETLELETDCSECGGTGTNETHRAKHIEELSNIQFSFLRYADRERTNQTGEGLDDLLGGSGGITPPEASTHSGANVPTRTPSPNPRR